MSEHTVIEQQSLEELVRKKLTGFLSQSEDCQLENLYPLVLAQVEKPLIELSLQRSSGNQLRAARMLGINRNTLRKKIQELHISLPSRSQKRS